MSNNLNYYRQQYQAQLNVARMHGLGQTQPSQSQPQSQPQPQPEARFKGTSRSVTPQSRQLYTAQPHAHAQLQPQPQVRAQSQSHSYPATGSSTIHNTQPNDLNTTLNQFIETLGHLYFQQRQVNESLEKSDKRLETLVSSVSSIRETAYGLTKKLEAHDGILEKLERSSRGDDKTTVDVIKVLVGEMKAFKKTLGKSCDGDDGRTVLGRLDAVTFAVGELLERARDPEANLPKPSSSAIVPPIINSIIDLTISPSPSPPPLRRTSPLRNRTYADVGTSPVPSSPSLKETYSASIQVGTSSSDSFASSPMESTPNPKRFSSALNSIDDTTTTPEIEFTPLAREKLDLASPIPMDVDPRDPTVSTLESQGSTPSTISTNNLGDATQTQTKFDPSDNTSVTTAKVLTVQSAFDAVRQPLHSDLSSPRGARTPKIIASLDDLHRNDGDNAEPLSTTPGPALDIPTLKQPSVSASISSHSPTIVASSVSPVPSTQTEVQRPVDESTTEGAKRIEKGAFDLDALVPAPGVIDLKQRLRGRPRLSSSRLGVSPSPCTSLSSSSASGSRLSIDPSEDLSVSSKVSSKAELYSPTKTKVLVGASSPRPVVHAARSAAAPPTTPTASAAASLAVVGVTASNGTGITVTTPIQKAASVVSSQSEALRHTKANSRSVTASSVVWTATPAIIKSPTSPARIRRPTASRSSSMKLGLGSSHAPTPSAAVSNIATSLEIAAITPTKNSLPAASSRLGQSVSPTAVFDKSFPPSQASSNTAADEALVSKMVTEYETDENDENFALKTSEENQGDRSIFSSPFWSPILAFLEPSDPGPSLRPAWVSPPAPQSSVPSTPRPRPRPSLSFTLQPHSPLASVDASASQNQTRISKVPNADSFFSLSPLSSVTCTPQPRSQSQSRSQTRNVSLGPPQPPPAHVTSARTPSTQPASLSAPLTASVVVVSSSCSPAAMDLDNNQLDQRHSQIPIPTKLQVEGRSRDEALEKHVEEKNNEDEEMDEPDREEEHDHHEPTEFQSPLFSSPSTTNNISVEKCEEEEEEQLEEAPKRKSPAANRPSQFIREEEEQSEEGDAPELKYPKPSRPDQFVMEEEESEEGEPLKLKSPRSSRRGQFVLSSPSEEEGGDSGTINTVTKPSKTAASTSTQNQASPKPSSSIETLLSRDLFPSSDVKEKGKATETDKMRVSDTPLKNQHTSLGDDADIVRVNVKKLSLLNSMKRKRGESAAITRVKKRKARSDPNVDEKGEHDDGLDREHPLKRARQRVSERQTKMEPLETGKRLKRDSSGSSFGAGSSTKVMKPRSSTSASAKKLKTETTPSKGRLSARGQGKVEWEWPEATRGDRAEDLVECNKCKAWYHYGCVGISTGDARLQGGKKFFCPPCKAGTTIKKPNQDTECWRPGCNMPSEYVVEKIIGRYKKFVGGRGLHFEYLLQWNGYSLSESTWEPEESMCDPSSLIDKFRLDALEEGIDIDKDKTGLILLRVAKDPSVPKPA